MWSELNGKHMVTGTKCRECAYHRPVFRTLEIALVQSHPNGIRARRGERRGTYTLFIFYYAAHAENTEK